MIKKITIEVIPHLGQRYNTVGDWQFERSEEGEPTALNIKVSDLGDQAYFILIGLHEAIEALLCETRGVKESQVDQFDLNWKPSRVYWSSDTVPNEPGEDYNAPYYEEHQIATGIERLLAARMFVNWARYEAQVDELIKDSEVYFARKALGEVVEEPKEEPEQIHRKPNLSPEMHKALAEWETARASMLKQMRQDETSPELELRATLAGMIEAVRAVNIERKDWYTYVAMPLQNAYEALGIEGVTMTADEIAALASSPEGSAEPRLQCLSEQVPIIDPSKSDDFDDDIPF